MCVQSQYYVLLVGQRSRQRQDAGVPHRLSRGLAAQAKSPLVEARRRGTVERILLWFGSSALTDMGWYGLSFARRRHYHPKGYEEKGIATPVLTKTLPMARQATFSTHKGPRASKKSTG
jgi:hypothetical protein